MEPGTCGYILNWYGQSRFTYIQPDIGANAAARSGYVPRIDRTQNRLKRLILVVDLKLIVAEYQNNPAVGLFAAFFFSDQLFVIPAEWL